MVRGTGGWAAAQRQPVVPMAAVAAVAAAEVAVPRQPVVAVVVVSRQPVVPEGESAEWHPPPLAVVLLAPVAPWPAHPACLQADTTCRPMLPTIRDPVTHHSRLTSHDQSRTDDSGGPCRTSGTPTPWPELAVRSGSEASRPAPGRRDPGGRSRASRRPSSPRRCDRQGRRERRRGRSRTRRRPWPGR